MTPAIMDIVVTAVGSGYNVSLSGGGREHYLQQGEKMGC